MRDLATAQATDEVTAEELRGIRDTDTWFSVCDRISGSCFQLRWIPGASRILTKHGLSGFAEVKDRAGETLLYERGRVHLCTRKKCGTKFDPRREPDVCHAIRFEEKEPSAPAEAVHCSGPAPIAFEGSLPMQSKSEEEPGPPEDLDTSAGAKLCQALRGGLGHLRRVVESVGQSLPSAASLEDMSTPIGPASDRVQSRSRSPMRLHGKSGQDAVSSPAGSCNQELLPSQVLPSAPAGASSLSECVDVDHDAAVEDKKREALELMLEEEAHNWAEPGFYLPLMALALFAFKRNWRLKVMLGADIVDVFEMYSPGLSQKLPEGAEEKFCIGCQVTRAKDSAEQHRVLRFNEAFNASRINHWVACISAPAGFGHGHSHECCGGMMCGGPGEPCMGPLLPKAAEHGLLPMPTISQGDCAIDVCCFMAGLPRNGEQHCALRLELKEDLLACCHEDLWLELFDLTLSPNWKRVAQEMLQIGIAPPPAPPPSEDPGLRSCGAPAERMGSAPAPPPSEDPGLRSCGAPAEQMGSDSASDLHLAIRWAANTSDVREAEIEAAIAGLGPEKQKEWIQRWQNHGSPGKEGQIVVAPQPGPDAGPAATDSAAIVVRRASKQYKSYVIAKDVSKAMKFRKLHKAWLDRKRLPRGMLARFLHAEGLPNTGAYYQHFRRVLCKLNRKTSAPVGFVLRDKGKIRRRFLGRQGAHLVKAPVIRQQLFEWFCQIRARIRGRLPACLVRQKAMALRMACIREALALGSAPVVPKIIGTSWLFHWKKQYNVSFRKPNKRWKVPRPVLLARLKIMWLNLIRVRVLAWLCFRTEMTLLNFDQKPFHTNESGSKDLKTLDFKGAKVVALKEIHSQTRERWTTCTACLSDKEKVRKKIPPILALCKGGPEILRACEDYIDTSPDFQHAGFEFKVLVSNSASMRQEHILDYLAWILPLLRGPGDDGAWRILLCDAYRAHVADSITRLAWTHKYVVVFVGGGATGVVQVNDTHLHGHLSRDYLEREQAALFEFMRQNPNGCPGRSRYQCFYDLMMVWKHRALHIRACDGFKSNQLSNALDGTEDHFASREVAGFWREAGMDAERTRAINEVCAEWEAKRLDWSFDAVYGLIEEFPLTGHLDFYEELQDDEGEDPNPDLDAAWNDGEDPSPISSDDEGGQASAPAGPSQADMSLDDAQQREVQAAQDRLASLDRALAHAGSEQQIARAINDVRAQILKQAAGRSQADSKIAQAIRRQEQLSQDLNLQRLELEAQRRRDWEAKEAAIQTLVASMEERVKELARQEAKAASAPAGPHASSDLQAAKARRTAIQEAAQSFKLDEMGQGEAEFKTTHQQARFRLINRVFALGDPRSPLMEANWKTWLNRLDKEGRGKYTIRWAAFLRNQMADLVAKMTQGEADACLKWYWEMTREFRLNRGAFVVPGSLNVKPPAPAAAAAQPPAPAAAPAASSAGAAPSHPAAS